MTRVYSIVYNNTYLGQNVRSEVCGCIKLSAINSLLFYLLLCVDILWGSYFILEGCAVIWFLYYNQSDFYDKKQHFNIYRKSLYFSIKSVFKGNI